MNYLSCVMFKLHQCSIFLSRTYWIVYSKSRPIYIYRREAVKKHFAFLEQEVINESAIGWILGPPGTGKSVTSFAFAMGLSRKEWVITWIHVSETGPFWCCTIQW